MELDFEFYLGYFPNLKQALSQFLPNWSPNGLGACDEKFVFSHKLLGSDDGPEEWVLIDYVDTFVGVIDFDESCTERGMRWFEFAGGNKFRVQFPEMYKKLIKHTEFADPTTAEAEIRKDICRTNRQDDLWTEENREEKQTTLLRVLKAYASFFPQIGYCQGMGCVAAMLLNELSEEYTFWVMVSLTVDPRYKLGGLWHPTMPLVTDIFQNMESLVEERIPKLGDHFKSEGVISCTMYGVCTWFITIFVASKIPMEMVHNIWDIYLQHGMNFIYQAGLGILSIYEEDLLEKNFEQIIRSFQETIQLGHVSGKDFTEHCMQFEIPDFTYDAPTFSLDDLRKAKS